MAHTHWDFEWYFSRQEARVQFAFHMDEVFDALTINKISYYVLDGQMSIVDDYLSTFPEKEGLLRRFVSEGRLFIGPWFTQIDEMVTSGESIIRNLRLGIKEAEHLGGSMRVGYLPDSFGQSQDMPKIYSGMNIDHVLFWRGIPKDIKARYFYWTSDDGSKVLTANIKDGYYAGVQLVESDDFDGLVDKTTAGQGSDVHLLPVGGDQRAVDYNLKQRITIANQQNTKNTTFIESNYPAFFAKLEESKQELPSKSGEFIEPTVSKIHRGIYSSRADLKQLYDKLERLMTYQVEPLCALAVEHGIPDKQGMIDDIWKTIARGKAHDSAGACNSDKTNDDILNRGKVALQEGQALVDYLLRKLSISVSDVRPDSLVIWNPLPYKTNVVKELEISTRTKHFKLTDSFGTELEFDQIEQSEQNASPLRRDIAKRENDVYYLTKIAVTVELNAMDRQQLYVLENSRYENNKVETNSQIDNEYYTLTFDNGANLRRKEDGKLFKNFITIEESGDEGDTYDYSPAFDDLVCMFDFSDSKSVAFHQGKQVGTMEIKGSWQMPYDLQSRAKRKVNGQVNYSLTLKLCANSKVVGVRLKVDNRVLDHRLRLVLNTDVHAQNSYSDTPFGVAKRPVEDVHLKDWQEIGYREEPTSMRPMIHFANVHSQNSSWSFITGGSKDFQVIGEDYEQLAVTILRGVGYLGRPDLLRRPGDASGLETRYVPTPKSQLQQEFVFEGGIIANRDFDPENLQQEYMQMTQTGLYYQNQKINRFTSPIQYFQVNEMENKVNHLPLLEIIEGQVAFSSLQSSRDKTGIEVRFYNPRKQTIDKPGKILLKQNATVSLLDLEGKDKGLLCDGNREFEMQPFKPGEIRTYGIYFKK